LFNEAFFASDHFDCCTSQSLKKIAGKNAKFAQNLRENCAENALKLRAICAIARKLRAN